MQKAPRRRYGMMTDNATPLMRQYNAVKRQHAEALLLFRLGDFYELFYQDAVVAARVLQITLTSRSSEQGQRVPMCGVPYHSAENYIARLLRAGHRVAICEQMEDPAKLKGRKLVRREVVRVITPGTATELQVLEPKENNFLAALAWNPAGGAQRQSAGSAQSAAAGCAAGAGLAYVDISTGEFRATEWTGPETRQRAEDELAVMRPRELLLPRPATLFTEAAPLDLTGVGAVETRLDDWVFREEYGERLLAERFGVLTLEGFGLAGRPLAVAAAGALLHYLRETSAIGGGRLDHLDRIAYYGQPDALALDSVSVRNLELVTPAVGDESGPTLLSTLDATCTPPGARLLRSWILRPAIERLEIEARLDAVAELKSQTVAREELRGEMAGVLDLERLTSRVALGQVTPRELVALRRSLEHIPAVRRLLEGLGAEKSEGHGLKAAPRGAASSAPTVAHEASPRKEGHSPKAERLGRMAELHARLDELADVRERIAAAIADEPPAIKAFGPAEAGMIRAGYNAELDELRALSSHSRQIIAAMEERERKRSGIASLKIRYNQVFGYYIEISKPNIHLAPKDFERKQTLANAERYTTAELKEYERKVLDADERILEIEKRLFGEVREWIATQAARLRTTAAALAQLDVLAAFAHLAAARNYTRPEFTEEPLPDGRTGANTATVEKQKRQPEAGVTGGGGAGEMLLAGSRHPVIEKLLEERGERFVPNDLYLDGGSHLILLITGPNMGGKSTYLRQAALVAVMAQMGSFIPAERARLPIFDRIFTRIGASDNLARGRSTFLVEMSEVAAILNLATPRSLVLLDEVGRGTATFDGLSIAWAVVEHLHAKTRARTLFATHYHELTELASLLPGVKNVHVAVRESGGGIIFLRHVEPGSADKSYGIEVARLAGLPPVVIERAREILARHEQKEHKLSAELSPGAESANGEPASLPSEQQPMFTPLDREVLEALRHADLEKLRPIDALNLLAKLKDQVS